MKTLPLLNSRHFDVNSCILMIFGFGFEKSKAFWYVTWNLDQFGAAQVSVQGDAFPEPDPEMLSGLFTRVLTALHGGFEVSRSAIAFRLLLLLNPEDRFDSESKYQNQMLANFCNLTCWILDKGSSCKEPAISAKHKAQGEPCNKAAVVALSGYSNVPFNLVVFNTIPCLIASRFPSFLC